ncbi:MAG: acyloxyacyl hydrolase [Gammaproteobacteria bacterium]|nr:acyloxyacyl hydrolase [Gammaproteobacteria bacterium]
MFISKILCLLVLAILPIQLMATGISIGIGKGNANITAVRVSSLSDWQKNWRFSPLWSLTGFWEASLSNWKGNKATHHSNDTITLLAVAPVFTLQYQGLPSRPYLQTGIGASWLSDTEIGRKELSTHFQFEDRAGIGIHLGPQQTWDLNLTAFHYSNGSIQRPNDGVNLVLLNLAYRF